jgi:hypothetical protein
MEEQRDPTYVASSQTRRKSGEARAARERLPVVWIVAAATIALVFIVAFVLAAVL